MRKNQSLEPSLGTTDEPVSIRVHERHGQRHAVVVPRAVSGLDDEQAEVLYSLQRVVLEMEELRDTMAELVAEARAEGVPWSAIGWSVGTTGSAAQQRWGHG